jgi:hypothetical protein
MKKILKRYHEPFSAEVRHPKNIVIENIAQEKGKKRGFFGFLGVSTVDFEEVSLADGDAIEINVKYKMLRPYRGTGKICLNFYNGKSASETIIKGEIVPYNGAYIFTVYMTIGFLLIWTLIAFIIDKNIHTVIMVAFVWVVFPLVLYLILLWNRSRLRIYRNLFLAILKRNSIKKNSIP